MLFGFRHDVVLYKMVLTLITFFMCLSNKIKQSYLTKDYKTINISKGVFLSLVSLRLYIKHPTFQPI